MRNKSDNNLNYIPLSLPNPTDTPGLYFFQPVYVKKIKKDGKWAVYHNVIFIKKHWSLHIENQRFSYVYYEPIRVEKRYCRPRDMKTDKFCACDDCKKFFKKGMKDHGEIIWK